MSGCEAQTGREILGSEIRHFFENLSGGKPRCEESENVAYANAHPANAWPAATSFGVGRDSVG